MTRSRTIVSLLASLVLGTLFASPALGALSASPNPSTTGSYTVSGSVITTVNYEWMRMIEFAPGGAFATYGLADESNIRLSFSSREVGTYTYQVQGCYLEYEFGEVIDICENVGSSLSVRVISPPSNTRPVADAGADQSVRKRASVSLDGAGSSDPDDDDLTYAWTQTSGTRVSLSGASTASPSFTAPATTGTLAFSLTVNDGQLDSLADSVSVSVTNTTPVADAGSYRSVSENRQASLDGSASSDADGDSLRYAWRQTSGAPVSLSSATAARPSFTAPELLASENLVFSLTVNDGTVASASDSVTVRVIANNDRPTANAGADQRVDTGETVTLSGSGTDPEGQALTYAWTQTSGSAVTLSGATTASPTFTAPQSAGRLVFSLRVNDGVNDSLFADRVTITVQEPPPPENTPPVAHAGSNQTVETGDPVSLDGSRSSDADDDDLRYAWRQTSGPSVSLSGATTASPSFTAPAAAATLVFSLVVNDGVYDSSPDTVTVTVEAPVVSNRAPTANAGADQSVRKRASVSLDGSDSSDPDDDDLTYAWSQTSGTNVSLSNRTAASPSFTAPASTDTLAFALVVNDGTLDSAPDTVTVTMRNTRPVADAGPYVNVLEGRDATLDGSGSSDADGDSLTYAWRQTAGTAMTLSSSTAASPTFTAPELIASENLVFSLTVNDGTANSLPDTVNVRIVANNDDPNAHAGADQTVQAGTSVTLNGAGTDPENQDLSYAWTQFSGTSVTLAGADTSSPTFTAPSTAATLVFALVVNDGVNDSAVDTVTVTVTAPLSGRLSATPNPSPDGNYTVSWSEVAWADAYRLYERPASGSIFTRVAHTASRSHAATGKAPGRYVYRLDSCVREERETGQGNTQTIWVCDPTGWPELTVTVGGNTVPVADAGEDRTGANAVTEGDTVTLDGSGSSDPDTGDTLSYAWSVPAGTNVRLMNPDTATPSFTAPELLATTDLVFTLTVSDGTAASVPDTVTVTVEADNDAPTADAGSNRSVSAGAPVTLNGSGSDPEGQPLSYAWRQVPEPTVDLTGADTATPSFTAPSTPGVLAFELIVNDGKEDSAPDTVTVTVEPPTGRLTAAPNPSPDGNYTVSHSSPPTLPADVVTGDLQTYNYYNLVETPQEGPARSRDLGRGPVSQAFTGKSPGTYDYQLQTCVLTLQSTEVDVIDTTECTDVGSLLQVTVTAGNVPPIAEAGPDRTVRPLDPVTLTGSGTDPDGEDNDLTHAWRQTLGATVELSGADTATPSFIAPATADTLVFELVVNDGKDDSEPDVVTVTVNTPPVAEAGDAQAVSAGATVTLDGSASHDPDGDDLQYLWTPPSGLTTFSGPTAVDPSFTAPSTPGVLAFELIVNDGKEDSAPDTVTVTVEPPTGRLTAAPNPSPDGNYTVSHSSPPTLPADVVTGDLQTYNYYNLVETPQEGPARSRDLGRGPVSQAFTGKSPGTYEYQLQTCVITLQSTEVDVIDTTECTDVGSLLQVTVTAGNIPPVVEAGPARTVRPLDPVTLAGSGTDPDGADEDLTYAWRQTLGATVELSGAGTATLTFTAPNAATVLVFELSVSDGHNDPVTDVVTVTVNTPPVAEAGDAQAVSGGATVTLDGSASHDPDGDDLQYLWTPPSGLTTFSGPTAVDPSFTAPSTPGVLVFELIVNDGKEDSAPDTVTVTVEPPTGRLTAAPNPSPDGNYTVSHSSPPTLPADVVTGDLQTYNYYNLVETPQEGPARSRDLGRGPVSQAFTGKSPGTYDYQLQTCVLTLQSTEVDVIDTTECTDVGSLLQVTVTAGNVPPIAEAGPNRTVGPLDPVTLTGSGTDPDGADEDLMYAWRQTLGATVELSGADSDTLTFTAPNAATVLVFELSVSDGHNDPVTDAVTVTVEVLTATLDANPNPSTGDYTVTGSATPAAHHQWVQLLETAPDGAVATYAIGDPSHIEHSFTSRPAGEYTYQLQGCFVQYRPDDYYGDYDTVCEDIGDALPVTVTDTNVPPIAEAGPDRTVRPLEPVTLTGSGTDPDGADEDLTHAWRQTLGATVELSGADTATPSFIAPATADTLVFELVVNDGKDDSEPDVVTVTVNTPPVAEAGDAQAVSGGATVTLDGSASHDPDGDDLQYLWTPPSGLATFSGPTAVDPSFTAPSTPGVLVFELIVNDGKEDSAPDTVTVTVEPPTGRLTAAPNPSPDGNYTVSHSSPPTLPADVVTGDLQTYNYYNLVETPQEGPARSRDLGRGPVSQAFTGKSPGTYDYQLQTCVLTLQSTEVDVIDTTECTDVGSLLQVTVTAGNVPPIAEAGPDRTVRPLDPVTLTGSGTDPDGEDNDLTHAWRQTLGATVELSGADTATPSFIAPATADTLVFELVVNDGKDDSEPDTVTVTVTSPPPPGGLRADPNPSTGDFTLSWAASAGANAYEVAERLVTAEGDGTGTWMQVPRRESERANPSQSFANKDEGAYDYRVRACIDSACGVWSAPYRVTVIDAPPTPPYLFLILVDTAPGQVDIVASWDPVNDATYELRETVPGGDPEVNGPEIFTAERDFLLLPAKRSGGDFRYRVRACRTDSACSGWSDPEDAAVRLPPPVPGSIQGPDTSRDGAYTLDWSGSRGVGHYELQEQPDGELESSSHTATASNFSFSGKSGGAISYRVRACNAYGCSGLTGIKTVTAPDSVPEFPTPVAEQRWTRNEAIAAFTVPPATGGDGTLTYTAGGLPIGVQMSPSREVTGTPLLAGSATASVTARDRDGDIATLTFAWTVAAEDLKPDYASATLPSPNWARGQGIVEFTAPAATGGNTPLSYTASGLPVGITMSAARTVSGTPAEVGSGTATVTVADADGDTASFVFDWSVVADDLMPSFGLASIPDRSWVTGKEITPFTAPAATAGNAPLMHGVNGLPEGVFMLESLQIEGTPTAAGSGTATVAARDADADMARVSFNWTVTADAAPSFAAEKFAEQNWTAGQSIAALTVPSATGGNGTLSYGASGLPDGVTLSPELELSGRPLATGSGVATVTARDADGDTATLTFDWRVESPNPENNGTVLFVDPNPTASSDYTVSGNYTGTRSYEWWTLTETNSSGQAREHYPAGGSFRHTVTNRVNGVYIYELTGCYFEPIPGISEVYEVCETVGAPLPVTVNGPETDSVGTQLADTYEARQGDGDGDGSVDRLYIKRTSEAVGGGLFQDVILQQASGGGFELVAAPPGSTAAATAASWPESTAVELVLKDINLDGFVDILVRGLGGSGGPIAGALDQIVYAPGQKGGSLGALRAVDDSLTDFLSEVSSWTQNPMFFEQHTEPYRVRIYLYRENCFIGEIRRYCIATRIAVYEYSGTVPTNASADARAFAEQFSLVAGRVNPDVSLGSQRARNLSGILQRVFGTEILNGQLEKACTGFFDYDSDVSLSCNAPPVIGEVALQTIEELFDALINPSPSTDGTTVRGEYRALTPAEGQLAIDNGLTATGELNPNDVRIYPVTGTNPLRWSVDPNTGYIRIPIRDVTTNQSTYFKEAYTEPKDLGYLLHELVHVLQIESGVQFTRAPTPEDYIYRIGGEMHPTKIWREYTPEQQAEMIADRYRLQQDTLSTSPSSVEGSIHTEGGHLQENIKANATKMAMLEELNGVIPDPITFP